MKALDPIPDRDRDAFVLGFKRINPTYFYALQHYQEHIDYNLRKKHVSSQKIYTIMTHVFLALCYITSTSSC